MLDSLVRVSHGNDERTTKKSFFGLSLSGSLGAWDWWSERENTKFEETFSTQRGGHSAELAGATTNSVFNYSRLWLWAATLHGDRESRRLRARKPPGNPRPVDNSILLRVNSPLAGGLDICLRKVNVRWATRCYSSSLIVDFRVSPLWQAVSSLAKKVAGHP